MGQCWMLYLAPTLFPEDRRVALNGMKEPLLELCRLLCEVESISNL